MSHSSVLSNTPYLQDESFALSIKHALNESANNLPQTTLDQLYAARRKAMLVRKNEVSKGFVLTLLQSINCKFNGAFKSLALAFPALVMVVSLYVMSNDNADNYVQTVAEIDSQVLTQDLPINALLDKGFVQYVQVGE
jgi:hypothetical protein